MTRCPHILWPLPSRQPSQCALRRNHKGGCNSSVPRIGATMHPNREWEIFNSQWSRGPRSVTNFDQPRWDIYHPALSGMGVLGGEPVSSLKEALDLVAIYEHLYADRFTDWRSDPRNYRR